MIIRQYIVPAFGPFNGHDDLRAADGIGKLAGGGVVVYEPVEVVMMQLTAVRERVDAGECKGRARYGPLIAQAPRQPLHEGRLAAAEIAHELDRFAALKQTGQPRGGVLRVLGPGSKDFVCHV